MAGGSQLQIPWGKGGFTAFKDSGANQVLSCYRYAVKFLWDSAWLQDVAPRLAAVVGWGGSGLECWSLIWCSIMDVAGTRWGLCCPWHAGRAAGGSMPPAFEGGWKEVSLPAFMAQVLGLLLFGRESQISQGLWKGSTEGSLWEVWLTGMNNLSI